MNSADLTQRGFGNWRRFNRRTAPELIRSLPVSPGVYCIRCLITPFNFARGNSDILYIGSATNKGGLQHRLRQYIHPGHLQRTNLRIVARCGDSDDYEVGVMVCPSEYAAKCLEAELLHEFIAHHGERPPENKVTPVRCPDDSSQRSKAQRMLDAVSQAPMGSRTRATLLAFVAKNDSDGMLHYLRRCVATRRDVGRSIRSAGLVSFESQMPEVQRIYDEPDTP